MGQYERARRPRRRPGENRAALLDAAIMEFGLRGYHGASTAAIAGRADVPQPHVYVHFTTKGELFLAALEHTYALEAGAIESAEPGAASTVNSDILALMHLQAVAALGESPQLPGLSALVSARIELRGEAAHELLLVRAAGALLRASRGSARN